MTEPFDSDNLTSPLPSAEVLRHVVDVHCHPTDTEIRPVDLNGLPIRICAMASRRSDQNRVAELARSYPDKIIPAFGRVVSFLIPIFQSSRTCLGFHPWFSHLISLEVVPETPEAKESHYRSLLLPEGSVDASKDTHVNAFNRVLSGLPHPFPLSELISIVRGYLTEFLSAHQFDSAKPKPMLGEVGLDRSFRVPFVPLSGYGEAEPLVPDDGIRLTPFFVPVEHQQAILEAQLDVAIDFGVNVSFHSVKAPAQTLTVLRRMLERRGAQFDAISIDMHSCALSVSTWKDIQVQYVVLHRRRRRLTAELRRIVTPTSTCLCRRPSTSGRKRTENLQRRARTIAYS
jgi:Tat protein secretion system quality control protein TatD with DNase activity